MGATEETHRKIQLKKMKVYWKLFIRKRDHSKSNRTTAGRTTVSGINEEWENRRYKEFNRDSR